MKLSQFHRLLHSDYLLQASPPKSPHSHHRIMWKPSFSFHFTAVSVLKRFYRRIKYFFIKQKTPTLPYYNPPTSTSTKNKRSNSSLLTFLSREDSNLYSERTHYGFFRTLTNWASFYWHRSLAKKQKKELD